MWQMVLPVSGDRQGPRFGDARDLVLAALEAESLTLEELVTVAAAPSAEVVTAVARLRLEGLVVLRDGAYGPAAAGPRGE